MWTYSFPNSRLLCKLKSCVQLPGRSSSSLDCFENFSRRIKLNLYSNSYQLYCTSVNENTQNVAIEKTSSSIEPFTLPITPKLKEAETGEFDLDHNEEQQLVWESSPSFKPSFNFSPFANDSKTLQKLVDMKVDLSKLERKYGVPEYILRLEFDKDIAPYIRFLCDNGIQPDKLGWYFTKNPYIFKEDLNNLEKRLEYLRSKNFSIESIIRIIDNNPFWLSFSITRIDRRLGFFQTFFELNGSKVRKLATTGPKLITSNLMHVKDMTFKVKEEMGFNPDEIVSLLLSRPRIWLENPQNIWRRFNYLHNEIKFSHESLVHYPNVLLARVSRLKSRIGFLQEKERAQFNPDKPNYVSLEKIITQDDASFATEVAKSSVTEFNNYLKSL